MKSKDDQDNDKPGWGEKRTTKVHSEQAWSFQAVSKGRPMQSTFILDWRWGDFENYTISVRSGRRAMICWHWFLLFPSCWRETGTSLTGSWCSMFQLEVKSYCGSILNCFGRTGNRTSDVEIPISALNLLMSPGSDSVAETLSHEYSCWLI